MTELDTALRLAVALLAGMAVGLEREWSGHATGPGARFAGVRTFALLGAIGALAGWLAAESEPALAVAFIGAAAAVVVTAYAIAARRGAEAIDGTTEVAAVLTLGIGVLAGLGLLRVASGGAAVVVLLLAEKAPIQRFVRMIGEAEMTAALQFAVLALVVLPLLPTGPIAALGGMRPRSLWVVVLIFLGLNFAGYVARRVLGDTRGYPLMGALGGLLSSTAVTLTFARQSRRESVHSESLALGTLAACTVLVPRLLVVTAILNAALLPAAALALAPVALTGILLMLLRWRSLGAEAPERPAPPPANPLQLGSAISMALAFQVVLWILDAVIRRFGAGGVLASAALLGLTDMDALTFGMNRLARDSGIIVLAAQALVLGTMVNSLFKAALAGVMGSAAFRRLALPALLVLAVSGGAGFWLVARVFSSP